MSQSGRISSGKGQPKFPAASLQSEAPGRERQRNHCFPARLRIKKRDEFQARFRGGQVAADGVLVLHATMGRIGAPTRIGISIAKKVGNAPQRNYWKRLIREAFRSLQHDLPSGMMLVVRPKKGAVPELDAIKRSFRSLMRRLEKKLR